MAFSVVDSAPPVRTLAALVQQTDATVVALSGIAVGDVGFVWTGRFTDYASSYTSNGYTQADTTGIGFSKGLFYKTIDETDVSNGGLTVWTSGNPAIAVVVRGVDNNDPIKSGSWVDNGIDLSGPFTIPERTTAVDGEVVMFLTAGNDNLDGGSVAPDNFTEWVFSQSAYSSDMCLHIAFIEKVTAGATGTVTWSAGGTGDHEYGSLILNPQPSDLSLGAVAAGLGVSVSADMIAAQSTRRTPRRTTVWAHGYDGVRRGAI